MTTWLDDIQKFGNLIEENIEDSVDVDELIATLNISKFHFYRLFKAVIGMSIHEYVKMRKLSHAASLLRNSTLTILEIAVQFGFASQEVFGRNFKRHFHDSPGKWRKNGIIPDKLTQPFNIEAIKLDIKSYRGTVDVTPTILHLDAMDFVGKIYESDDDQVDTIAPKINSLLDNESQLTGILENAIYRICFAPDFNAEPVSFKEFIGIRVSENIPLPMVLCPIKQKLEAS